MTGSVTRGVAATGAAIVLLGLLAPAWIRGATGGQGTISPWSGVVGDPISIEVRCPDGEGCGNADWACPGPRRAEVGFHPVGQPWGDPPGYGASWVLAVADSTGRRFRSNVPAIEPGPYSVSLRCDAGDPLHIAGPGFGATDGPYVDFAVIPLVRPGSVTSVWLDSCGHPVVDLWISTAPDVTRPDDRRLTPVRIVRQSGGEETPWPTVAWFRVPAVAAGEYFAYVRLGGASDCFVDWETGSGVAFAPVAVPAAAAGLGGGMGDLSPGLVVVGAPDSAMAAPPAGGSTTSVVAVAGAFLLGVLLSLRRTRPRNGE